MSIFLAQENGDFAIVNNQLQLTDNSQNLALSIPAGQETLQLIRNILRMSQGEEELDPALGTPYFQQIFVPGATKESTQSIVYNIIANVPGVQAVTAFSLTVDGATRRGTVNFTVLTSTGPVTSSESFP